MNTMNISLPETLKAARGRAFKMSDATTGTDNDPLTFSLVRDDFLIRLQRLIGLAPANGLGVVRRVLFWTLLAWLPIAVLAWNAGRVLPGASAEPLLAHFGIQVRFLVANPLLIIAEAFAHSLTIQLLPHFVRDGLVRPPDLSRFRAVLAD